MGGRDVIKKMGYRWHLRRLMAARNMWQTTDLVPLLAERGVTCPGNRCSGWSPSRPSGCRWTPSLRCATSWTAPPTI